MRLLLSTLALCALTAVPTIALADTLNLSTGTATYNYVAPVGTTPGTSGTAVLVNPINSAWTASISGAQWIAPSAGSGYASQPGGNYTYTATFIVCSTCSYTFSGSFAADNFAAISLGTAGSGSSNIFSVNNNYLTQDQTYKTVVGLGTYKLTAGTYTLTAVVNNLDGGNPTGLLLGATATATPEPSSLLLLGTGLASFAGFARRKFRA